MPTYGLKSLFVAALFLVIAVQAHSEDSRMAAPVLAAPINATWAANHAEAWHEKGFRGFLFQGILDDLSLFPSEKERLMPSRQAETPVVEDTDNTGVLVARPIKPEPVADGGGMVVPGDWDALTGEIRGAVNRLRAAGIDRNFLHIALAPEYAWFTDHALRETAQARFQLAAEFCRSTNLRGIAVDTRSSSFIYDYRWDGYGAELPPESLAEGARQFGLHVLRAFIRAFPDGEIIVLADSVASSGPLWFNLIEGVRHAPGAAHVPLYLGFLEAAPLRSPPFYQRFPQTVSRLFDARTANQSSARAQTPLDVIFTLEPVRYRGDMPVPAYSLETYRRALHAAALHGGDYLLINAPDGGWWQIPPDMADQFQHLRQGGAARVRFAPPIPRTLDAYAPRLVGADSVYVGSLHVPGLDGEVFKNDKGAALLLWSGTQHTVELPTRQALVSVTNLVDLDTSYLTPREEVVSIPPLPEAAYVEGLPLRHYALPASMNMDIHPAMTAGVTRGKMEFGLRNHLAAPLRGTLSAIAGDQYALGASNFSINLAPSRAASFARTLRGLSQLGTRPQFTLNLSVAAESPLNRSFTFSVAPEEGFSYIADAALSGAPLCWRGADENNRFLLFNTDMRGRLSCFSTSAEKELWHRRLAGRYTLPPVLVRSSRGAPGIAVASDQGRLRLFSPDGVEKLVVMTDEQGINALATTTSGGRGTDDLLVLGHPRAISLYDGLGELLLRKHLSAFLRYLVTDPALPNRIYLIVDAANSGPDNPDTASHEVIAMDGNGKRHWEAPLPCKSSCAPLLMEDTEMETHILCVGLEEGGFLCLDADTGETIFEHVNGGSGGTTHLAGFYDSNDRCPRVFYADTDRLFAVPLDVDTAEREQTALWDKTVADVTALAPLPGGDGIVAGTFDGSLYALTNEGGLLWEDHRGTGPIINISFLPVKTEATTHTCLVSCANHRLRSLQIHRDRLPAAPHQFSVLTRPEFTPP